MEIKFNELNEGWTCEFNVARNCAYISRPREVGGGFVTVSFKSRQFSAGHGSHGDPVSDKTYKGAGWRDRLVQDAVRWLETAMAK